MRLEDLNYCIAKPNYPGVWNLYTSEEAAGAALAQLKAERPDEFADYSVMLFDEWNAAKEASYLEPGLQEIDEETYEEMLGVLPPLKWEFKDGVDRFCMSEFTSGRITNQYGKIKCGDVERFFCKPVIFGDPSTYITSDAIAAFDAKK